MKTLETTPPGETHWSTRSMAKAAGVSHTMVGRIWRTFRLQPHRTESLQALAGSATRGEDPGRRRAVRGAAGECGGLLGRREVADPGAATRATDPADGLRPARATDPQLRAAWHAGSVRRAQCRDRRGDRPMQAPTSGAGFRRLSARDRSDASSPTLDIHVVLDNLSAHRAPPGAAMVAAPSARPLSFHADLRLVAQSGGALLWTC